MTMNGEFDVPSEETPKRIPGQPAPGRQRRTSAEVEEDNAYFAAQEQQAGAPEPQLTATQALETREAAPVPKVSIDTSATVAPKPKLPDDDPRQGKRFWVQISHQDGAPNYETIGVNGITCQVKRGEKVPLYEPYVEVLRNGIQTKYTPHDNGQNIELIAQESPSVPFSILGECSDAEYQAWKAAQG